MPCCHYKLVCVVITSSRSISSSFLVPGCDSGESDDDVGSAVEHP